MRKFHFAQHVTFNSAPITHGSENGKNLPEIQHADTEADNYLQKGKGGIGHIDNAKSVNEYTTGAIALDKALEEYYKALKK